MALPNVYVDIQTYPGHMSQRRFMMEVFAQNPMTYSLDRMTLREYDYVMEMRQEAEYILHQTTTDIQLHLADRAYNSHSMVNNLSALLLWWDQHIVMDQNQQFSTALKAAQEANLYYTPISTGAYINDIQLDLNGVPTMYSLQGVSGSYAAHANLTFKPVPPVVKKEPEGKPVANFGRIIKL